MNGRVARGRTRSEALRSLRGDRKSIAGSEAELTEHDPSERDSDSDGSQGGGRTSARSRARRLGWWLLAAFYSITVAVAGTVIGEVVLRTLP
jgi:hypothetical protein